MLQAVPAATTEDVSLMATPAQVPKLWWSIPDIMPIAGKMSTPMMLNKNMVEMAWLTYSSLALIAGAAAAMAEPPHMAVPTPIRVAATPGSLRALLTTKAVMKAIAMANSMRSRAWPPTLSRL